MSLETIYFYAAIAGGVVLLSQLAMMLLGGDDGGLGDGVDGGSFEADSPDSDSSTDHAGFWFYEMISLRTVAAAVTFFGLVGGAANSTGQPPGISIALGCFAGYAAMYGVYWAFKQIFRLETSGNVNIYNAIGLPAEVYVPIGPGGNEAGKVHVYLQGRTAEYQALTTCNQKLPTGSKVIVTEVLSSDTVEVMPTSQDDGDH